MPDGGKNGEYITGYWYAAGMQLVYCQGPVDQVSKIWVGEEIAWEGTCAGGRITIDAPELHGGEDSEGGVAGDVDVEMGLADQEPNDYLQSVLGADVPAFRGLLQLVLRRPKICANNAYIKPWSIMASRIAVKNDGTAQWYGGKAAIGDDLNPAHILRECLTDPRFGLGCAAGLLDEDYWQAAADTLYDEDFGLSFLWTQSSVTIQDFMLDVLRHIDGSIYLDPPSGKLRLVLVRDDYDPEELDSFGESDIIAVQDFTRSTWGRAGNEIIINYTNRETNETASQTIQDLAAVEMQGRAVPFTVTYPGICGDALAVKVAARDLKQSVSMLAKMTIVGTRRLSGLQVNSVFNLNWPPLGIDSMIVRVLKISYGSHRDGQVKIEAVQDVFGLPDGAYSTPQASMWTDPVSAPQIPPNRLVMETPYWTVLRRVTGESGIGDFDVDAGLPMTLARRPTDDAFNYKVLVRDAPAGEFITRATADFTPTCLLGAGVDLTETDWTIGAGVDLDQVTLDAYALIDDELVAVQAIDPEAGTLTVDRGVLDTVPAAHDASARIWFAESAQGLVVREYYDSESIDAKMLTRTGKGLLSEASAPIDSLTFDARAGRPYPPGKVLLNGSAYPASISGELTVSWAHRDRTQQTVYLVTQSEGNIGPEAGTTYTLRIYGDGDVLKRTATGLTGTSYTYLEADEKADNGGNWNAELRIELESVRDGYTSWQYHDISVTRT